MKKQLSKFGIGQRVNIKHPHTGGKTGTVRYIQIRYGVQEDGGFTFWYDAKELTPLKEMPQ